MITLITIAARTATRIGRLTFSASSCVAAVATIWRRRGTYHSLSSLDDRALQDIGLNRTMLLDVSLHGIRAFKDAEPPTSPTP